MKKSPNVMVPKNWNIDIFVLIGMKNSKSKNFPLRYIIYYLLTFLVFKKKLIIVALSHLRS